MVVGWGQSPPSLPDSVPVINGGRILNKLEELEALRDAGVPTVEFSREPVEGWLGRSAHHSQGLDLLRPPSRPDYWVQKETFAYEARVHIWRGMSIRAGIKVPVPGETQHDWIRSRGCGWYIRYDGVHRAERDAARAAVEALQLDFGAVDIGIRVLAGGHDADAENRPPVCVLEVNRAPGLEGVTVQKYAEQIRQEWEQRYG